MVGFKFFRPVQEDRKMAERMISFFIVERFY